MSRFGGIAIMDEPGRPLPFVLRLATGQVHAEAIRLQSADECDPVLGRCRIRIPRVNRHSRKPGGEPSS